MLLPADYGDHMLCLFPSAGYNITSVTSRTVFFTAAILRVPIRTDHNITFRQIQLDIRSICRPAAPKTKQNGGKGDTCHSKYFLVFFILFIFYLRTFHLSIHPMLTLHTFSSFFVSYLNVVSIP